ncbi:SDR family NAD(P)-dependent oxidoreductase [Chelatococcus sambhunathii]|uniref:SDR family NAD(P)-dependent oxidoreductase n=1 Tax=Chelatococcus sambhunathii TaxID=363953 RepID=A0ABU1DAD9_9HYPH|nr:SDR family NAD(P)-dependent oxidoreductase [Chelatococcus sambhunathii]MDR4305078.1 SDR family NAD(P)-dependent oxidoreductase [Chelatococcus sambhunathii]
MSDSKPLAGRIAVVTGATRGIGNATALALAKAGAHVVATGRTQGGLEELDDEIKAAGGSATLAPFDVTDYEAIDRLGAALYQRHGKLDILVGNAGALGQISPLGHIEPQDFEKTLAINLTANWRLIRSLDPLLRASDAGRAVFVTSGAAHKERAYWGLYAATKAGLEALARAYAAETRNITPVRVMLVNPGPLATAMRKKAMPGEDQSTLKTPADLAPKIVALCAPDWSESGKLYDFPTDSVKSFRAPE